jgi:hypothetical protein
MLYAKLQAAVRQFENIESLVNNSHRARESNVPYGLEDYFSNFSNVDASYAKVFDYCAAVTRAYSTYERFVLDAVEQWVEWCFHYNPTIILQSATTLQAYEAGVAEIFRRSKEPRFSDIDRAVVAKSLAAFHGGRMEERFSFIADPFFATLPNINIEHVDKLFREVGVDGVDSWLADSPSVSNFAREEGFNVKTIVKDFVARRNEAAHGNGLPENIFGAVELSARITLLKLICESLSDLIFATACQIAEKDRHIEVYGGCVTKIWDKSFAFELKCGSSAVSAGENVTFMKRGHIFSAKINSIQLEGLGCKTFYGPKTVLGITLTDKKIPSKKMSMIFTSKITGIERLSRTQ